MTDEAFMALVEKGIEQLRPDVQARMENVAIVIADEPSARQRQENGLRAEETLFGLYEGVPQTERGFSEEPLLPDRITIFKLPILEAYSDEHDVATCVANTVWHEVAHHFGMDEDEVAHEEVRRGKHV